MTFAEQQRQAYRERQKRLGKVPPARLAASRPTASLPAAILSVAPDAKASACADASARNDAALQIEAGKRATEGTRSDEQWQINPASGVRAVVRAVARYYAVSVGDLISPRRRRKLIRPRHVAMYLAREFGKHSFAIIGGVLGRDHTTIMHACRRIAQLRKQDSGLDREIRVLIARLMPERRGE